MGVSTHVRCRPMRLIYGGIKIIACMFKQNKYGELQSQLQNISAKK